MLSVPTAGAGESFNMHGVRWFYWWQYEVRPTLGPAYGIQLLFRVRGDRSRRVHRNPLLEIFEAVRDADGREMVEALIAQFERDCSRMPVPPDPAVFANLRRRLGL